MSHALVRAGVGRDAPQRWPRGSGRGTSGMAQAGLRGDEGNNSALGVHAAGGSGGHAVEGTTALVAMQLGLSIAMTQWQAGAGRSSVEACFTRQPVVA
jgi:hypothetical protein